MSTQRLSLVVRRETYFSSCFLDVCGPPWAGHYLLHEDHCLLMNGHSQRVEQRDPLRGLD